MVINVVNLLTYEIFVIKCYLFLDSLLFLLCQLFVHFNLKKLNKINNTHYYLYVFSHIGLIRVQ